MERRGDALREDDRMLSGYRRGVVCRTCHRAYAEQPFCDRPLLPNGKRPCEFRVGR